MTLLFSSDTANLYKSTLCRTESWTGSQHSIKKLPRCDACAISHRGTSTKSGLIMQTVVSGMQINTNKQNTEREHYQLLLAVKKLFLITT